MEGIPEEHPQAIAFRETWTDCLEAMGEIEGSGASSEAKPTKLCTREG